jgi:hypothetical protein
MKGQRLSWIAVLCVFTAAHAGLPAAFGAPLDDTAARAEDDAPLFRVFLKDGSSLTSYGEYARVGDRVVFSMPTATAAASAPLHLVDIASDRVDWERTIDYAESARASRYVATRAARDYALLTKEVERRLDSVALTGDPLRRLAIVQEARRTLAVWPSTHYGYKQEEIRDLDGNR